MRGKNQLRKVGAILPEKQPPHEETQNHPRLLPLTAKYDEPSHRLYVDALNEALGDERIHNIALSGHYGVGKSSILDKVAQDNEELGVVALSLSSLRVDSNGSEESKTNQIQKEIVKQLLYRETPSRTSESRYKRLAQYDWTKRVLPVAAITLFLYLAMHLAGWTTKLVPFPEASAWWLIAQLVGLYLLLTFLVLFLHATTFNRIWIDKVTTGTTTLSLTKPTDTYFDEFLDELVYFFEVSKTQVVIFEDLDRFNDPAIFENLRALNALLNNSKQLRGRSVRFIYAIRDSIFDSLGDGSDNKALARSSRTKFFDVVVPVVPFITHSNARDLMTSVMGDVEHKIPENLIRIAARHVADMRVLKNVRNEFLIFRDRIFGNGGSDNALGLSEANLYAMVLYKNTHLGDFEKISKAESDLDRLYAASRLVVNSEVRQSIEKQTDLSRQLADLNSIGLRSARLGTKLAKVLEAMQATFTNPSSITSYTMLLNGTTTIDNQELLQESTWRELTTPEAFLTVTFNGSRSVVAQFALSDIEILLGESLSVASWSKGDQASLEAQLRDARDIADQYRKADFADLIHLDPKIHTEPSDGNSEQDFKEYAFACLGSDLARELVSAAFIDRNFTLYTSVYHGVHVSVPARNFIMKCIEPQAMDAEFNLEPEDVKAILSEIMEESLGFTGAYNIDLLDYLLLHEPAKAGVLVKALASLGEIEREFLGSYWTRGSQQLKLAFELAKYTPEILNYLVSNSSIPDSVASPINSKVEEV